jgi:hypothetical protein
MVDILVTHFSIFLRTYFFINYPITPSSIREYTPFTFKKTDSSGKICLVKYPEVSKAESSFSFAIQKTCV